MATKQDFFDYLDNLSVLELSKLVKELEERYGVTAMPAFSGAVVAGGAAPAGAAAPAEAAQEEFTAILTGFGDNKKINVLKVVREITGLGLKEAKELVESVPKPIKEGVPKAEAEEIKKKIEAEGGTVQIK